MQELFGSMLEHVSDIIFVKNSGGTIIYGNEAFRQLFAPARREGLIGGEQQDDPIAPDLAYFLADDLAPAGEADLVQSITDWSGRVRMVRVSRRAIEMRAGQRLILAIATDVTELFAREQALVGAAARLREWASVAAHDLRAPIGSYVTAISIIQNDPESALGAQSNQYLELISDSASNVVQQLSAMILRERGERQPDDIVPDCDLNLILAEVRACLAPLLAQGRVVLDVARLPAVAGDRAALRRLFLNLVEYGLRRRVREHPRMVLRYARIGGAHHFTLEDNGRPMAPEARDALVRPLRDGEPIGAGIGLAECQRAVARHGGGIAVDPLFVGGCRIQIQLPVVPASGERSVSQVA
jgi:PAS domain S-box-containing protein